MEYLTAEICLFNCQERPLQAADGLLAISASCALAEYPSQAALQEIETRINCYTYDSMVFEPLMALVNGSDATTQHLSRTRTAENSVQHNQSLCGAAVQLYCPVPIQRR